MTLPTLIQQLRAARPDSLTELREAIAVVAEAVVATSEAVDTEIRLTSAIETIERLRVERQHIAAKHADLERLSRRGDAESERLLGEFMKAATERDAALADVQRLTAERDSQQYEFSLLLDAARHSLRLAQDERDRLAAEVKTLRDELANAYDELDFYDPAHESERASLRQRLPTKEPK